MPKRARRWWLPSDQPLKIRITYTSSGTIPRPPAERPPLDKAVAMNVGWARGWYGDRAVARFLREHYKASCKAAGRGYTADDGFKHVAREMDESLTWVKNKLNRSTPESAKREKRG
jgi:hypothetical protein